MNMERMKKSRRMPEVGDIFVYRIKDHPYGFGRVIRDDARIGGFGEVFLLYLYDAFSETKTRLPLLDKKRLLLPPVGATRTPWSTGYVETIKREPLKACEILPSHCFWSFANECYCDEYGKTLRRKHSPCGSFLLGSHFTLDVSISMALGVPPSSDTLPP